MSESESKPLLAIDEADRLISRAAGLHPIEYQRERSDLAKQIDISVTALDKLVKDRARAKEQSTDVTDCSSEMLDGIAAWADPVAGDELAFSIKRLFNRYCSLPPYADVALTLWAIATYTINEHRLFPKLSVVSPQPRCGKTTLLEVLAAIANRVLSASNVTAAVLFRVIDDCQPTLLIDECDTFVDGNSELGGIINCGHTRSGATVLRVEGDAGNRKPTMFSTWTPMALFRIGTFSPTIQDRSITVPLMRKLSSETVERLPIDIRADNQKLRRQCVRWHEDNRAAILECDPAVPCLNNDRAEDNWRALITIADVIGGEWPELARTAAKVLTNTDSNDDDLALTLLKDINQIATDRQWNKTIFSKDLCEALNDLSDKPWPSMRGDKGINPYTLSKFLKPFSLVSGSRRFSNSKATAKGYKKDKFDEVYQRYCVDTPKLSGTPAQPAADQPISQIQSGTNDRNVPDLKTLRASNDGACDVVPDFETVNAGESKKQDAGAL